MKLIIDEDAQEEARQLVAWYVQRDIRAAKRLEDLIVEVIERIAANPLQFPLLEIRNNVNNIRRARLPGFPIIVVYQLIEDRALVVAFQHTSRRPGYWRRRLDQ